MGNCIFDWLMNNVLPWLLIGGLALAAVGIPVIIRAAYLDSRRPTFELKKDDWVATASHQETITTQIMVGSVMVPRIDSHIVVDQWTRKPR